MEAVSRIIQSYWRRRTYQRLEGKSAPSKKQARAVRLRRRRRRRSKAGQVFVRVRIKVWSPSGLLNWIRDGYVDALLGLALNKVKGGQDGPWGRRVPEARETSARPGDFEGRMMVHMYNSVVADSQRS